MTSCFALFVNVDVRLQIGSAHTLKFFDEFKNRVGSTFGVDRCAVDFRAVAG